MAEGKRLARLDAAIAEMGDEDDADALEALRRARRRCAERIAGTQPLGRRLAVARRAYDKARAELTAAEEAAAAAAERAQKALVVEHEMAEQVRALEAELTELRGRETSPLAAPARDFMSKLDAWVKAAGLAAPPEVMSAAADLRAAIPQQAQEPDSPTDLEAEMTDSGADAPTGSGDGEKRGREGQRTVSADGRAGGSRTPPPRRPRVDRRGASR